jgi:ATP-dependent protease HslVU (ClpYQ) peptidase subunit
MSIVIGMKVGKKIYMGCDSAASTPEGIRRHIKIKKIIKYPDEKYLVGVAGSVRVANLLAPEKFKPPASIKDFAEKLRKIVINKGAIIIDEAHTQTIDSNLLIAVKGVGLYEVLSDFQLNEITEYSAIGAGSDFALGCVFGLENTDLKPKEKIEKALMASCYYHGACAPPFVFEEI